METTLFEVKFKDGRIYRVFCRGRNQKKRFREKCTQISEQIEVVHVLKNGIHLISEFEKL